jgi:hypothetical protein
MVSMPDQNRVREARVAFQAATADEFTEAIEQIVYRKVQAFASGVDPDANVVFETFYFEPQAPESEGNGHGGPGEITRRQELLRAEAAAMVRDSDSMRAADERFARPRSGAERRTEPNAAELLAQDFSSTRRNASWWPLTTRSAISPTPRA